MCSPKADTRAVWSKVHQIEVPSRIFLPPRVASGRHREVLLKIRSIRSPTAFLGGLVLCVVVEPAAAVAEILTMSSVRDP